VSGTWFRALRRPAAGALVVLAALSGWTSASSTPAGDPAPGLDEAVAAHLERVAAHPRPPGSPEHDLVARYIEDVCRAAGAQVHSAPVLAARPFKRGPIVAGMARNVVAVLPGTRHERALLIVGHYDSVATGPGASDDGVTVAAMLATLQTLSRGPRPQNDLVFLFSDAEETGQLGAQGFAARDAVMNQVAAVLNFEGRGSAGPPLLFQTGLDSGGLVRRFARALKVPLASSASDEVYARLPNDTDFSVFRERGLPGLNFASIDGFARYHTATDDLAHVDRAMLQHRATQMLALVQALGNADLARVRAAPLTYFTILGRVLVRYPLGWSLALALLAAAAAAAATWRAGRTQAGRPGRAAVAGLGQLLLALLLAVATALLWRLLRPMADDRPLPQNGGYVTAPFTAGVVLFTFAALVFVRGRLKRWSAAEIACGATLLNAALALLTAVLAPGASYLFTWPALAAAAGVLAALSRPHRAPAAWAITLVVVALVVAPFVYTLAVALGPIGLPVVAFLSALMAGLLLPLFAEEASAAPAARSLLALAALTLLVGRLVNRFDADRPRPDALLSLSDTSARRAVLASPDGALDRFTRSALGEHPSRGSIVQFLPEYTWPAWTVERPYRSEAWFDLRRSEQAAAAAGPVVALDLRAYRRLDAVDLRFEGDARVVALEVGGAAVDLGSHGARSWLQIQGVEAGASVTIKVATGDKRVRLSAVARTAALPNAGALWQPRPAGFVAVPSGLGPVDIAAVRSDFSL